MVLESSRKEEAKKGRAVTRTKINNKEQRKHKYKGRWTTAWEQEKINNKTRANEENNEIP